MSSEWSGLVTVSSLPHEVQAKRAMNARLLENALRTPNVRIGESATGQVAGLRATVRELAGGATAVTVDTLSMLQRIPPPAPYGPIISGEGAPDPYAGMSRNQFNRARFTEFFAEMVRGRGRIREYGPHAGMHTGSSSATGVYYDSPPYSGSRRPRAQLGNSDARNRGPGFPSAPPQGGYTYPRGAFEGYRDVADHGEIPCGRAHPTMSHSDWLDLDQPEEEEERMKQHSGISCSRVHGLMPHRAYSGFFR